MKRVLIVIVLLLAALAPVVSAQGPGPVYLPFISKGHDMDCTLFQELRIETLEGGEVVGVDLLADRSGFHLTDWQPALADPKAGGVWRDSQLAEGRRLALRRRANTTDTLTLAVRNWTPDDLIRDAQELRRLLEKACAYGTTSWQDEPVWVKRHPVGATNAEYTIIHDYRTPQDPDPHGSGMFWTSLGRSAFPDFVLILEHEPFWRACRPGTGACAEAAGQQVGWIYGGWGLNTTLPDSGVREIIELASGRILATDTNNQVWRSDNGTTWNAAVQPPTMPPYAMCQASDGDVFLACWDGGANVSVWRSADNGVNFISQTAAMGTQAGHSLVEFGGYLYLCTGDSALHAVGGTIRRSNNDGVAWTTVRTVPGIGPGAYNIIAASDGYLYAIEESDLGPGVTSRIVRSNNGTTWNVVYSNSWQGLYTLVEADDGYIYASGRSPGFQASHIVRSSNGTDWNLVSMLPGGPPTDMIHASDGYYYFTDSVGRVWKSSNAVDWALDYEVVQAFYSIIEWSGNGRLYVGEIGDIFWNPAPNSVTDVGRSATCEDEVYVANKANVAQFTHVWEYEDGVGWTNHFPSAAVPFVPFNLLPNPMSNDDAIVLTIDTAVTDSGPFDNAVFDVSTPASGTFILTWYYPTVAAPAWPPPGANWTELNVHDGTINFQLNGVNSLHFVPPSDWAQATVNLVTGYHVVGLVGGVVGNPVGPQQGNRDVYTCNWPRVDVDDAQVPGDIPALLQIKFRNRSDEDGYEIIIDELDTLENRAVVGLRSLDRGPTFTAYLNCSDEQNPPGVAVAKGAATAWQNDPDHPTGRSIRHTTDGASTWADACTFTLGPTIARDFYGRFHAYFRGWQENRAEAMDEVRLRLQVRTGSGGLAFTTEHRPFRNLNDWQLVDFGGVAVPASGSLSSSDLGDQAELAVQVWSSVAGKYVNLYDLILIPTDEWALDAVDKQMEDDSGVTQGYLLDADSVTYPKKDIRAFVRQAGSDYVRSQYQANTPGPAVLQANADQRLWFLTARGVVMGTHTGGNNVQTLTDSAASFLTSGVETGQVIFNATDGSSGFVGATVTATTISNCGLTGGAENDWDTNDKYLIVCPNWRSEPWNCHSVQLVANARYLGMRGAR